MVQLVEHRSQAVLYHQQCLHRLVDDAGVCAHEGEGICMEARDMVSIGECRQCASCVLDRRQVGGLDSGSSEDTNLTSIAQSLTPCTDTMDLQRHPRKCLHPATAPTPAPNFCAYRSGQLLSRYAWQLSVLLYPQLDLAWCDSDEERGEA